MFVRFPERNSPRLKPWLAHARRVLGEAESDRSEASIDGFIVWQLVSANNRELARGIEVYETFEEARAQVGILVTASGSLTVEYTSEAGHGLYGWYLKLDGRPVATCARWYLTERDRRSSISLATRSLPVAAVHAGARLTESLSERASLA